MTTKPEDGYVRFWIEDGVEVAMLTASDFRTAMNERDRLRAENKHLRALIDAVHEHAHLKPGCPLCEALFGAGAQG